MTTVTPHPARLNGASVAAFLAAAIGLLSLGIVVLLTELSVPAKDFVFAMGKAWIPGAQGIGPYSGKETVLLIAWLGSWVALHFAMRHRSVNVRAAFAATLVMLALAVALIWPPVWHLFE